MRRWLAVLALCACGDDKGIQSDAANDPTIDAAIDAPATSNQVACGTPTTTCPVPEQYCCDVQNGPDTCMPSPVGACAGDPMECDGHEDCASGMECCLFQNQGSRCLQAGVCGATGAQSDRMCHTMADCMTGESCCGTAPGPAVDVYFICTQMACP